MLCFEGLFLENYGKFFRAKRIDNAWILYDLKESTTIFEIRLSSNDAP